MYRKRFKEGGLTLSQLMALYEHSMERKIQDMRFSAILHGADPKDLDDREAKANASTSGKRIEDAIFKDPSHYANMSDEEKKRISDKMRSKLFVWTGAKENG